MTVVYALPLPEAISTRHVYFCTVGKQPAIDGQSVAAVTTRRCHASLNLSFLCYDSQRCTLAVAQHFMRTFNFRETFKHVLKIYGIWPQARLYTHTSAQCNPASVGLAQARPNKPIPCCSSCQIWLSMYLIIRLVCSRILFPRIGA